MCRPLVTKLKKPICKVYMLYDSTYITFWKRKKNYEDRKKINHCQSLEIRDRLTGRTWNFQGSEPILYDTILVDICHYTFVQTIKCTPSIVNPNVNYGFWVIMMCLQVHQFKKMYIWATSVDSGKGYACIWAVLYGKSLYLSLNFSLNLKTALKKTQFFRFLCLHNGGVEERYSRIRIKIIRSFVLSI